MDISEKIARSCARRRTKWTLQMLSIIGIFVALFIFYSSGSLGILHKFRTNKDAVVANASKARYVAPADLMARPLAPAQHSVPRLFHQSWSTAELPAKFQRWSDGCRGKHPDWEWVLWTDDDNRELIKRYFPWLLDAYNSLKGPIYRADLARNAYMVLFGGIYADLDIDCLLGSERGIFDERNITTIPHLQAVKGHRLGGQDNRNRQINRTAFFGRMGTDESFTNGIPNAWMASPPAHPFFFLMLEWTRSRIVSNGVDERAESLTGPEALHRGIPEYRKDIYHADSFGSDASQNSKYGLDLQRMELPIGHDVEVLPFHYIYPYSWGRDGVMVRDFCWSTKTTFNETRCKELLAVSKWPSTTITYWSHSWSETGHNKDHIEKISSRP